MLGRTMQFRTGGALQGTRSDSAEGKRGKHDPSVAALTDGENPIVRWELLEEFGSLSGGTRRPSRAEAERFLQMKGATVFNLLAAAAATEDQEFARRAANVFPEHPAVQLAMLSLKTDLAPDVRAEWIERFKASSPDNPLPLLYAAREAFARKDSTTALAEASLAAEKSGLYCWSTELIIAKQGLFEVAGYYPVEAELLATFTGRIPRWGDLYQVGTELEKLHEQALKDGDSANAEKALRAAYSLAKMFQSPEGGRNIINRVYGLGLEGVALNKIPPETQPPFLEVPIAHRKAELRYNGRMLRELGPHTLIPIQRQDANLLAGYLRRIREEGEYQALLWIKEQTQDAAN